MDLLSGYGDDNDPPQPTPTPAPTSKSATPPSTYHPLPPPISNSLISVNLAPEVTNVNVTDRKIDPHAKQVTYNATYEDMWAPVQTVSRPFERASIQSGVKNHLTGFVENHNMNEFTFKEQFYTFHNYGFANDPSANATLVANLKMKDTITPTTSINNNNNINGQFPVTVYNSDNPNKPEKKKRKPTGSPGREDYLGPWAGFEQEEVVEAGLNEEQRKVVEAAMVGKKRQRGKRAEETEEGGEEGEAAADSGEAGGGTSIFHGKQLRDYQGRSYIDPPSDLKNAPHDAYLPKKWIHTWTGHTKGVAAIRFFPTYGHLILSAGMDEKVKIWDVYNDRKCLRTFMGHSKAVRDICWSNDGRRFLSCGYDKYIKLWDAETGTCLGSFTNGKIPYCVKFNPDDDKQNIFVVGCSDKKIIQWDINSKQITQEYDQHLGAVNTITFIDQNRRFVTSSDDKSLRVWEWGIPVVIKYISEPHMHSMPAVTVHPNGNWFACQSLDNQILIYSTKDRFKLHKKKRFMGHTVAGYACQITFSPDGRYIACGDGSGRAWFWDWKTSKLLKTLRCHDQVSIGCEWHPIEPSRVATCSWDGTIKYWD